MTSVLIGGSCTDVDTGSEDTDSAESDGPVGEAAQAVTWVPRPALTHPGSSHLGRRLAMSGDGLRIIAAGAYDTDVAVFTRTGLTWGATGATLNSSVNGCWGHFGESVAIDGTTAWVGAPVDVPSGGAACQFGLAANGWTFAAEVIEGAGGQHFGAYVALSGDHGISAKWLPPEGCVVSIWDVSDQPPTKLGGGTFADGGCGPVAIDGDIAVAMRWVGLPAPVPDVYSLSTFELSSAGVTSLGDSSLPDPFFQPSAMALSGQTLVIGYANESVADVFTRPPSGAWNLVEHWPSSGGQGFGYSVDVSDSHIVVGAPGDDDNGPDAGAVYVYKKAAGGDWVQDVKLTAGAQSGDLLGESVAVGGSPFPFVAAGAPFAGTDGEVFLYALTNENGAACAGDLECTSSHCSDGVCCGTACNNPCDACSLAAGAQTDGTCANVADGSAGNPACAPYLCAGSSPTCPGSCLTNIDCVSGHHCDADNHCVAKLAPGNPCSSDGQCATGNCKDGVCCDTPCGGACKACNLAGSAGTCADIPSGQDPASECQSGACNGAGACELDNGQSCANGAACLSGHCADGVCCNTACNNPCDACSVAAGAGTNGTCANLADGSAGIPACAPYLCNGSSATCPGTCAADADCVGGDHCDGSGHCVAKKAQGQPCSSNGECTTGYCADGVCCNTACNNPCDACSVAAGAQTDGTCANVADGGAGTPACAPYLCNGTSPLCPQSCTSDADCVSGDYCDAAHHCVAKLAQGQGCSANDQCASGSCADGVCCNTACGGACDACSVATGAQTNGTCAFLGDGSLGSPSCAPYLCDGSLAACPGSCTTDGDCVGGTYCDAAHHCVAKLAQGQGCSSNNQCASGSCADGVCCNDPCTGGCRACTEAKTTLASGTCGFVTAATDPDSECSGAAGDVCNGAGACSKSSGQACSAGTECLSGHCYDGTCCNAPCGGVCEACDLNASPGICTKVAAGADPDLECPGGASCDGAGACALLGSGVACASNAECANGYCTDGVCCTSACNGLCQACNVPGWAGQCTPIPAGADPASECVGDAQCNGAGACIFAAGQVCTTAAECASGFCADGVCCDEACAGACRACSASKTGGQSGTCANIPASTDPDGECAGTIDCNGTGACELTNGQACATGAQCQSGQCVEGVCCNSACSGTCRSCLSAKTGQADGQCSYVEAGDDPDDECSGAGGDVCGGAGTCIKSNGQACSGSAQCLSGYCADGTCCNTACSGVCEACDLAGSAGICTKVTAGDDPDQECPGGASCNGAGACALLGSGAVCASNAECASGSCADGRCCNTACDGACEACNPSGQCSKIAAGQDPADECLGAAVCNGAGACVKAQGASCVLGAECASGSCVDGRCCNEACTATCQACSAVKTGDADGTCAHVTAGTDPDADCAGLADCNGTGACELTNGQACATGAQCQSGQCVEGVCCNSACSGTCRSCLSAKTGQADGQCSYIESGDDPDDECSGAGGDVCGGAGTCIKSNGQTCSGSAQCLSGYCADGTCCNTACSGVCEACDLAGSAGICTKVTAGDDPDLECPGGASCDGAGACALLGDGIACASNAECANGYCTDVVCCTSACNGLCQACNVTGWAGQCTPIPAGADPASECAGDAVCNGDGACIFAPGQVCTTAAECASGFCADGVCCDEACAGACRACSASKTGGQSGTCANIPASTDPDGECAGTIDCNGTGACELTNGQACATGAQCQSGQCVEGVCCNSACSGTCRSCLSAKTGQADGQCSYVEAGDDPDDECSGAGGDVCGGAGTCIKSNGQACSGSAQCLSGYCADGTCCSTACSGVCEACDLVGSAGICTKVTAGDDPDQECPGGASCNGAGACALLGNGIACASNAECASGSCADGRCCNTACDGACEVCNPSGQCSKIAAGQDPADECLGAAVCNGAGACVKAQGASCVLGAECASGSCVDGRCCDEACSATCQACSAAKTGYADGTCAHVTAGTDPDADCAGLADCNGAGACEVANGQACSANSECQSGQCVEGVCCNSACSGTCKSCLSAKTGQADGQCSYVEAGDDPDDECSGAGGDVCGGAGTCIKSNGQTCSGSAQCLSGYCADGTCCNTACSGVCEACDLAGSVGICTKVTAGGDPDQECPGGASCDGAGACALLGNGAACASNAECASGSCADGRCCNTACDGACEACNPSGQCSKIAAGQDPADECLGAAVCNGAGACVKAQGASCVLGAECASGSCVDGRCCDEACSATCQACSAAKTGYADGTCAHVTAGTDPDADCAGLADCNGAGACEVAIGEACSANSECQSGQCVEGVCCNSACGGACRSCLSANTGKANGQCGFITAGLDPDGECSGAGGDLCDGGGACIKAEGAACATGAECLSGHCYDGVCCDTACSGTCETCNLPGSPGECVDVPAGTDPAGDCSGDTVCNGAGACTQLDQGLACTAGAECESGFCADGVCCDAVCGEPCKACVKVKTGFANGMCAAVIAGADPDDDCAGTGICNGGGACVAPLGESCAAGAACLSGSCVDGVCCDSACTDLCHACSAEKTNAPDGTCAPVQSGTADAECKADKACDGAGACKRVLGEQCTGGADCVSGFCADGVCCDTACDGTCETCKPASGGGACTPYPAGEDPEDECDGVIACGGDGACGPGLGLGETCALAAECESGFCADGSCCESACDGPCAACNSALTQQPDGACAPVDAGTDPDGECPGSEACDGAFACKPGTGVACAEGADCLSGFCVDGVCCDTACGGGDLHDCQACSAMAGGPKDGTCLPVTAEAAIVCRPAAAACDAAETCNGATIVCPGDEPAAAGEPCDDGDPLTADDSCDGNGTCAGDTGCDDGNPCTQGDVWQLDGTCAGAMSPDGTPCDDGEVCTEDDICQSGVCSGDVAGACEPPETGWGGGGCMCSLPGDSPRPAGWIGLLAGLIGLAGLRLRRRAHAAGERRRSTATAHGNGDGARRRQGSRVVAGFSAPRTAARTGAPRHRRGPCLTA